MSSTGTGLITGVELPDSIHRIGHAGVFELDYPAISKGIYKKARRAAPPRQKYMVPTHGSILAQLSLYWISGIVSADFGSTSAAKGDLWKIILRAEQYSMHNFMQLELLKRMWNDPRVQFYDDSEMPPDKELADGSAFLVGPTSRHQLLEYNWRCQAVNHLRNAGFKGIIYVPEPRGLLQKRPISLIWITSIGGSRIVS